MKIDHIRILARPFSFDMIKDRRALNTALDTATKELNLNELYVAAFAEEPTASSCDLYDGIYQVEARKEGVEAMWEALHFQEEDGAISNKRGLWAAVGRRLTTTADNRVGLVPKGAEKGNIICILHGSHVPVVLGKKPDGESYEVICQCCLEGVMYSEAVTWEEDEADMLVLE